MDGKIVDLVEKHRLDSTLLIDHDETVAEALMKMAELNVGALLVMDEDELAGIFSERDFSRKILLQGRSSITSPVAEVMSQNIVCVTSDYSLEECLELMNQMGLRHLPVLNESEVVAFLSHKDITEALIDGQRFELGEMTKYLSS